MNKTITELIARKLDLAVEYVESVVKLYLDGATIPFIARYRKEATGMMNEVQIAAVICLLEKYNELIDRKKTILKTIDEQGKLTETLKKNIEECWTSAELEDIYLPFKPKKKTKASVAIERGLEPLAKIIMSQNHEYPEKIAARFLNQEVKSIGEALQGARDIIAEWVNENTYARNRIRKLFEIMAILKTGIVRGKEEEGLKYKDYYNYHEKLRYIPSHRFLAIMRAAKEGVLKIEVEPEAEEVLMILEKIFIKQENKCAEQIRLAIKDSYKRLLQPSMESEVLKLKKEIADDEAIAVFTKNLRQLLMEPPLGQLKVMGIDPGFRTGCKIVCLDETGALLDNKAVFPHPPVNEPEKSAKIINKLIEQYQIQAIAIGDGTAGRETYDFIRGMVLESHIRIFMVNEDGASIYSASEIAREELGDYDLTVRGAVSIGRRLMDPLAELVKIDPKSIGVGQYQHDVDQSLLKKALEQTTESCVNMVGVELNTASKSLLTFVSGIGPQLATNIINYRNENSRFCSREELKKVKRMGEKAFEQCAGFLRIKGAVNPLDNSAVHPESYYIVEKIANSLNCKIENLINNKDKLILIKPEELADEKTGVPTITDIIAELEKPGRDPRSEIIQLEFSSNIRDIADLKTGMILEGIVTNITNFGAFVDIGVKQDGLVHISELADRFVKNPYDIVQIKQKVKVRILNIDQERKRINLSMKNQNN